MPTRGYYHTYGRHQFGVAPYAAALISFYQRMLDAGWREGYSEDIYPGSLNSPEAARIIIKVPFDQGMWALPPEADWKKDGGNGFLQPGNWQGAAQNVLGMALAKSVGFRTPDIRVGKTPGEGYTQPNGFFGYYIFSPILGDHPRTLYSIINYPDGGLLQKGFEHNSREVAANKDLQYFRPATQQVQAIVRRDLSLCLPFDRYVMMASPNERHFIVTCDYRAERPEDKIFTYTASYIHTNYTQANNSGRDIDDSSIFRPRALDRGIRPDWDLAAEMAEKIAALPKSVIETCVEEAAERVPEFRDGEEDRPNAKDALKELVRRQPIVPNFVREIHRWEGIAARNWGEYKR